MMESNRVSGASPLAKSGSAQGRINPPGALGGEHSRGTVPSDELSLAGDDPIEVEREVAMATEAEEGFSPTRALGNLASGFVQEGKDLLQGLVDHPVLTLGGIAGLVALGVAAPVALGWLGTTAFAFGLAHAGVKSAVAVYNVATATLSGKSAEAEKGFEEIGRGAFDATVILLPGRLLALGKRLFGGGANVIEASSATPARAARPVAALPAPAEHTAQAAAKLASENPGAARLIQNVMREGGNLHTRALADRAVFNERGFVFRLADGNWFKADVNLKSWGTTTLAGSPTPAAPDILAQLGAALQRAQQAGETRVADRLAQAIQMFRVN
jgi:hypothetical protein